MKLKKEILEKITEISDLLSQIDNYWTRLEIIKSNIKENSATMFELEVHVYTFIKEKELSRQAYLIREKYDLKTINKKDLEYLTNKIKELIINPTKEND